MPKFMLYKAPRSSASRTSDRSLVFLVETLLPLTQDPETLVSVDAQLCQEQESKSARARNVSMRVLEREKPLKLELDAYETRFFLFPLSQRLI